MIKQNVKALSACGIVLFYLFLVVGCNDESSDGHGKVAMEHTEHVQFDENGEKKTNKFRSAQEGEERKMKEDNNVVSVSNRVVSDDGSFKQAISFEEQEVPSNWKTDSGGKLFLSQSHFKHGFQSLGWEWAEGASLQATKLDGLKEAGENRRGGISFWVYSEEVHGGDLTFQIGARQDIENDDPRYIFSIKLNFTGWRGIWIQFREDGTNANYKGNANAPLEVMKLLPPENVQTGTVFFDVIEFENQIPDRRSSDWQVPLQRDRMNEGKGGSWDQSFHWSLFEPNLPLPDQVTTEQKEAFETIVERYEGWIYGKNLDLSLEPLQMRHNALQRFIRQGVSEFNELKIVRDDDGNISGLPMFASRSNHSPNFDKISRNMIMPLVYDYKLNGNVESKQKLMDLFDYMHDQGWAAGSGLETLDHETNRNTGYFHAVFLMRDELKETGRLQRELDAIHWFTNFGKTYGEYGEDYLETTADEVRTRFLYKLLYVLAQDDTPAKVRDMQGLIKWMNHALSLTPGFAGTIKSDYMGFHHRAAYMNAYATHAYQTASLTAYLLHDTPFALEKESIENVKNALLTLSTISHKYDVPVGVGGRFPTQTAITNQMLPAYAYLAMASHPIDLDLAGEFMRLWDPNSKYLQNLFNRADTKSVEYLDTLGGLQLVLAFAEKQYDAASAPSGFWVKPTAALAILRRDDWMVSTKGWSQYVFDYESQTATITDDLKVTKGGQNVFGRYSSYGAVQIFAKGDPIDTFSNGYRLDSGWDWNRWPGTTTIHLPWEDLIHTNNTHRSFSDQTFVGGVVSQEGNGLFALKMHDTTYNPSFFANKTYFYFDNEIIMLGSNISNDDKEHHTETTLFQTYMTQPEFWINGEQKVDEKFSFVSSDKESILLMDPLGNGYFVPDGTGVNVTKEMQSSRDQTGRNMTAGLYNTAWIDHGKAPEKADYEYVTLVQSTVDDLNAYAQNVPYEVLQKDENAHVLWHKQHRTYGYAVFNEETTFNYANLRKASVPIAAMEVMEKDTLRLSLANPDLGLAKLPNQRMDEKTAWHSEGVQWITVELNGEWTPKLPSADLRNLSLKSGKTSFEFRAIDGKTVELMWEKVKGDGKTRGK